MSKYTATTAKSNVKRMSLAILLMFVASGCAGTNVGVVRALNPASAGIKVPASSVMLSFSSTRPSNDPLVKNAEKQFEDALRRELVARGFTLSQDLSKGDFRMYVVLSDVTLGRYMLEKYGQKFHEGDCLAYVTWDISYLGPYGGDFGAVRKKIGSGPVSFMTKFIQESDCSTQTARYYGPGGVNIPQTARDIAEFRYRALINPPK